jgi:peptidoglycan/xylan/chitin deacetylase (PgdA/CDA1 family)
MTVSSKSPLQSGAFVVSLDFELHWGMRDHTHRGDRAFDELLVERSIVDDLAATFSQRDIRATWAIVGQMFASTQRELTRYLPIERPVYQRAELDPYLQPVGEDEEADPEHLAGSIVRRLTSAAGQEIGSHTFSHYYCLEAGQTEATFRADLAAAQAIAGLHGLHLASLVLPRNQWNPRYARAVLDNGFRCIRGPQRTWSHRPRTAAAQGPIQRAGRLVDAYVGISPPPTTPWNGILTDDGLCDVPASAFLRPYSRSRRQLEPLRMARLTAGLRDAARRGRIFHLWWHPHNFAQYPKESFDLLNQLLDEYDNLAESHGMRSLSMGDVADEAALKV